MGIYILSALGLAIKCYIFFVSSKLEKKSYFYTMLAFFALHNLSELLVLFTMQNGGTPIYLLKSYYSTTFCALTFMVIYAIKVSQIEQVTKLVKPIAVIGLSLAAITFSTDLVVKGVINISYTATADRGTYYLMFPVFVLFTLMFTIGTLLAGIKKANTNESLTQSFIVLLALSPLLLCSLFLLPILVLGIKINATGIIPVCTTAFLFIIVKSEVLHNMTSLRRWLPFSLERKLAQDVVRITALYSSQEIDYKKFKFEIERASLQYKYLQSGKNMSEMSRIMGIKRSSLYSIMERHKGLREDL